MNFTPHTPGEIKDMLAAIGVGSIQELFSPIPAALRAKSFDLPTGVSEFEMLARLQQLAAQNSEITHFVGGGYYDHLIPAAVDHLAGRSEFYTAYTPYQPEASQGSLQALFEYQTAICRLTGHDVSNASLYDGGTALAEAAMMALRATGRSRLLVDGAINPFYRAVLKTYLANLSVEIVEMAPVDGMLDLQALNRELDDRCAALLVQNPTFFGCIADYSQVAEQLHNCGALLVASVYPVALGLIKSPAEMGVDIAVGDGQSLGNHLSFGGPAFGFISASKKYIRNMPGRIVGETVDREGRRGFVLTLQAREQHIKRHKATSNICSNQSLCALRGLIFLAALGRQGLVELAVLNRDKAEYAKATLSAITGVTILSAAPTFNEFTISLPVNADRVVEQLIAKGIAAGVPLGQYYQGAENCMVVTVTEKRSREEIDRLALELDKLINRS
ncbi:aminomethyl-transferring glycine dehydrogenase subunit GcvPA [Geobacter pelophilus]|uniref:Probable glycine dehydrogenase (decarboxylating) subunit 1 n=1 Tax=Geoanaerobacter pelophilus TaxID=60036 RepID=A0AAW4L515_9BACT|nr:aminomethyl-transferring glycine dehydrogenase subunit GcvPA [Geoanaerobacter pelophilus]MBT0665252.1 aminomethyl-transferring glycine dehydrogenase subunit GcvPA [Geoanaerobacter pelophilus]